MSDIITVSQTVAWLIENDSYLILTHRRPDGDTIGCAGALAHGLRQAGKTAFVLPNPEVTARYAPFVEDVYAPENYTPEHVIVVDTASYALFPANARDYINAVSLCIDHHPSNKLFANKTCLVDNTASCGEVVYEILMQLNGNISAKCAECLYVAVSTDTGCFVFANTTSNTLRVAALLIEAGAPHVKLNKKLFRTKTRQRVAIEGMIASDLELYFDGKIAIASISNEMMRITNADEDDLDDIASFPSVIDGVIAGITIRELSSPTDCKVSVRSSRAINSNDIASLFGGGGHAMAAGFSINMSIMDTKKALLEVLPDFIPVK